MEKVMSAVAVLALALLFAAAPASGLYGYSNTEVDLSTNSGVKMNADAKTNTQVTINSNSNTSARDNSSSSFDSRSNTKSQTAFKLSNGLNANIKIMPEVASEIALEALRMNDCSPENNCSIRLREINDNSEIKAVYEMEVEKEARILGIFKKNVKVRTLVDAETGNVIQVVKPWYAVLTAENRASASAYADSNIGIDRD